MACGRGTCGREGVVNKEGEMSDELTPFFVI
jgi:hypothetical protein